VCARARAAPIVKARRLQGKHFVSFSTKEKGKKIKEKNVIAAPVRQSQETPRQRQNKKTNAGNK